jgi:Flp pilus assembly protein TadB
MGERNDRDARALQDDRGLRGWKVAAAIVAIAALVALTITSVYRAPNDVWTIVIPVVAAVLVALLVRGLLRGRRRASR